VHDLPVEGRLLPRIGQEALLPEHGEGTVYRQHHVEQQVAAATDDVDELVHELGCGVIRA